MGMTSTKLVTRQARNGDATIVYHVAGDGPAVCLIASTGRGPGDLHALAEALLDRQYKVILPEPRGIGGSSGPLDAIDFHDLAADAAAVVAAEGARAIVAGHAYGCWIARTVAADHPELVRGIALLAAGAGQWPAALSQAIDVLAHETADEAQRLAALRLAFFAPGHDPRRWLQGWHADVVAAQRVARARTPRESWWHSGTAPILDLVGRCDPFRPAAHREDYAKEFGERLTLQLIDDASHALPDEKPLEVAAAIDAWARQLP
jgi:pimeloyl-ACP methyl ester carboxylesterase